MNEPAETKESKQPTQKRISPQSELDLVLMTTDSVWGKPEVSSELKSRLNRYYETVDETGKKGLTIESLWGLLSFYTRDMRLANLNQWDGELEYVRYFIDLAGDFLHVDMINPFLVCLSRAATRLELSQSKGGFLRKRLGTITEEKTHRELEPPKKSLFGAKKKKEEFQ